MANFLSNSYVLLRFVVEWNGVRSLQQGKKGKVERDAAQSHWQRREISWTQRCREKKASEWGDEGGRKGEREGGREGGRGPQLAGVDPDREKERKVSP